MSPAPGWFPDPGGSGRLRYWDGQQWTGHLADLPGAAPTAKASSPPPSAGTTRGQGSGAAASLPESAPDSGSPRRSVLLIALAAVVLIALIWATVGLVGSLRGGGTGETPTGGTVPTASPTITGWDEQDTPPPSPTPTPPPPTSDPNTVQVLCPVAEWDVTSQSGSNITAGGFTFPRPTGWDSFDFPTSSMVTGSATLYRDLPNSSWMSTIEVGYLPGFEDEKTAARSVLDCYFTSSSDHGYESNEVLTSEEITIDGQTGWWLKVRETNPDVPGTYAILHAIVIDAGDPQGMRTFWTTAYEQDTQAVDDAEHAREALRLAG